MAYFGGLEQLRSVDNIDKLNFLQHVPKSDLQVWKKRLNDQINNPNQCMTTNQVMNELTIRLGNAFLDKVNTITFGDLLSANTFLYATDDLEKQKMIQKSIDSFKHKITQFPVCKTTMEKFIYERQPLFRLSFYDWNTMLRNISFTIV